MMEKKMETTMVFRFFWDNGKENGNYYKRGLYRALKVVS